MPWPGRRRYAAGATEMHGRLREKDERIGALETELDAARALGEDLRSRAEKSEGAADEARTMAAGLESPGSRTRSAHPRPGTRRASANDASGVEGEGAGAEGEEENEEDGGGTM